MRPLSTLWVRLHTASLRPNDGESTVYFSRRRHYFAHLYAERSPRFGQWAGRGCRVLGLITVTCGRILPPPAGRAGAHCCNRSATGPTGQRPGPAHTGLLHARKERKRTREMPEGLVVLNSGWGRGALARLKMERASDG